MRQLSVLIPESLYQNLILKAVDFGEISVSDTVRILLQMALKNSSSETEIRAMSQLQKHLAHSIVSIQALVETCILELMENSEKILELSNSKYEKLFNDLLKKSLD